MTSTWIFLVSFFAVLAGCAIGMTLRVRLPKAHLNAETRDMIRLGSSLLATLTAVLISLTIASAKSSYEKQDAHFRQLAAYLVETDQLLAQYGPEATGMRQLMREAVPAAIDRIWREKATASQDTAFTARSLAEQLYTAVEALSPKNDIQRGLKARVEQAIAERAKARGETPFDVDEVIDHVVAPIIYHILYGGRKLTLDYCHSLLDRIRSLPRKA